jgi:DNA-binding MarR family transcriptional regulator
MDEPDYPGPAEPMIGALLRLASEATHRELVARLDGAGFDDLRPAHYNLFTFPGIHGVRPTELAQRRGISKQALNALLNELEDLGYLVRRPSSGDGRHRQIELAPRGLEFARTMRGTLEHIETELASLLGARRFADVKAAAGEIAAQYPP